MRHRTRRDQRGTTVVTVLVLAVSAIYLGIRAWTVMHLVLVPPPTSSELLGPRGMTALDEAKDRDRVLAAVEVSVPDPFNQKRIRETRTVTPVRVEEPPPQLRMILYDQLSPEVQFSVGEELSGRLRPGQSFHGWTVVSIAVRSCVVEKDGRTLTLTPRR